MFRLRCGRYATFVYSSTTLSTRTGAPRVVRNAAVWGTSGAAWRWLRSGTRLPEARSAPHPFASSTGWASGCHSGHFPVAMEPPRPEGGRRAVSGLGGPRDRRRASGRLHHGVGHARRSTRTGRRWRQYSTVRLPGRPARQRRVPVERRPTATADGRGRHRPVRVSRTRSSLHRRRRGRAGRRGKRSKPRSSSTR
jgi:hypothetical protein